MSTARLPYFIGLVLAAVLCGTVTAAEPPKMAAPKPTLDKAAIRGLHRGVTNQVKLMGKDLGALTEIKSFAPEVKARLLTEPKPTATAAWAELVVSEKAPRGAVEISALNAQGESVRVKLYVDVLAQTGESTNTVTQLPHLPVGVWGELAPIGDTDTYEFTARAGQQLVFELSTKTIASPLASPRLRLFGPQETLLATAQPLLPGEEAFLIHTFNKSGSYRIEVSDTMLAATKDQFYRLSVGELPFVTLLHPNTIHAGETATVQLSGVNLGLHQSVTVEAKTKSEIAVPLPDDFRGRSPLKVLAEEWPTALEREPNNSPGEAQSVKVPMVIGGKLQLGKKQTGADVDLYRFEAKEGETLMIETLAVQRGSLADTKIEVLHADGRKVERVLLQATRDSWNKSVRTVDPTAVEIRTEFWEEMELNQYLYMAGEVVKLYRWPFGPDSGFHMYFRNDKRVNYFDTTGASHALYEPFYIVEPHPPGTKLVPNGLPAFTLYYENDDDAMRELGSDSRLMFKAPKTGAYLVRVSDSRGSNGELNNYRLTIRPAQPDYRVQVKGVNPAVPPGNGRAITVEVDRLDGFEGEVRVDIQDLPAGFYSSSPIVVQPGHFTAEGVLFALPDAKAPAMAEATKAKAVATAQINGKTVMHEANSLGTLKLDVAPKFLINFIATNTTTATIGTQAIPEIVIHPGETIGALIKVARMGETNLINLDMDNLPHGVIVDNVGLNGVQVRAGENEREIFIMAFKWVPEMDRLCQVVVKSARATAGSQGLQTSFPVMLKVRHRQQPTTTASK
ncbi:MAG: translocation protein TolB [Verrucomicrobia bacterium]|jgi:hypothetical protein|nr:translocation protein TolB [Verrucomicrobiota bacterium]